MRSIFPLLVALLLVSACDSDPLTTENDLLVVEAFLYAGKPVDDIRLTKTISLSSDDSVAVPVNSASVTLLKNGQIYPLTAIGSDGRYEYQSDDLTVNPEDVFELNIEYEDQQLVAETTVPSPPMGTLMSQSILYVPDFDEDPFALIEFFRDPNNLVRIVWDNPEGQAYFVSVSTPASTNPQYVLPENIQARFAGLELVLEPTNDDFFEIPLRLLDVFGTYSIQVFKINDEYVNLYENREQDSRDLNEPLTNIQGGLGIFSAFAGNAASFELKKKSLF